MVDTYQDALESQVKFAQEKGILRTPNPTFVNPATSTSAMDWSTANSALPYFEAQGVSPEAHRAGIAVAKASLGPNPSTKVTQMIQEATAKPDEAVARYRDQSAGADRISQMPQAERERAEAHLLTFAQRNSQELADPAYTARQVEGLQNALTRHNGLAAFDISPDLQRLAYQSYRDVHAVMSHYLSTGDAEASARYASSLAKSRDVQHITNLHNDAIRMEAGESSMYGGATGYSQFHTSRALESAQRMLEAESTSGRLGGAYFANNFNRLVVDAVTDGVRQEHGAGAVFFDTKSAQGLRDLKSHVAERMDLSFVPNPDGHGRQVLAEQVIGMLNEQHGGKPDFRVEQVATQPVPAATPAATQTTPPSAAPATAPEAVTEHAQPAAAPTPESPRQAELFHEPASAPPHVSTQSTAAGKVEPTLATSEHATSHVAEAGRAEPTFANHRAATSQGTATTRVEPTLAKAEAAAKPAAEPTQAAPATTVETIHSAPAAEAHPATPEAHSATPAASTPEHVRAHEHAPSAEAGATAAPAVGPVAEKPTAPVQAAEQLSREDQLFAAAVHRVQGTVVKTGMLQAGAVELHNPVPANGGGEGLSANVHGLHLNASEETRAMHAADVAIARASLGAEPLAAVSKLVQDSVGHSYHNDLAKEYAGLSGTMKDRVQFLPHEQAHFNTFGFGETDAAKSAFASSPDLQRLALHSYADAYSVVNQHIQSGAESGAKYAANLALMRDVEHIASLKSDVHQLEAGGVSHYAGAEGYGQFHTSRAVEAISRMLEDTPADLAWDKHSINAMVGEAVREGIAHEHGMGLNHDTRTVEGLNAMLEHRAKLMPLENMPNPHNLTKVQQAVAGADHFYPQGVEFRDQVKVHMAETATPAATPGAPAPEAATAALPEARVAEAAGGAAEAGDIAKSGLKMIGKDALKVLGGGMLGDALALEDLAAFAGRALRFTSGGGKVGMYGALATGVGQEHEVIQNVFDKTGITSHVNEHAAAAHEKLEAGVAHISEWARPVTDQLHKVEHLVEPKVQAATDYVSDKASAVGHTIAHHTEAVTHAAASALEPVTSRIAHAVHPVTEPVLDAATDFVKAHKSSVDAVVHVGENITGIAMLDRMKGAAEHAQEGTVQTALNNALKAAGHEGAPLSAQEAQTVAAELRHVKPGDALAIETNGNIHLVPAGTQAPKFPEGATHVDAEALREAAGIVRAPVQVANLESTHGSRER